MHDLRIETFVSFGVVPRSLHPDLMMVHHYQRADGTVDLAAQLLRAGRLWPGVPVLVIANPGTAGQLTASLNGGARGFVTSAAGVDCIAAALRLLVNNLAVYPMAAFGQRAGMTQTGVAQAGIAPVHDDLEPEPAARGFGSLTARQQQVLVLLSSGMSNRSIAQHLDITESTVKVHIRSIMTQTGVTNRTQIVARFLARD